MLPKSEYKNDYLIMLYSIGSLNILQAEGSSMI